jgi:RES domain-containing protein
MIIYRFSHKKYAADISGTGSKLKGGRWNFKGIPVVYSSERISLGLLETLVNTSTLQNLVNMKLMEIEVPQNCAMNEIKIEKLKKEWFNDIEYCQFIGSEILKQNKVLLIKCPSAVVFKEFNYLINPLHVDFKKIKLRDVQNFYFDDRLFK